jgi:glutathione S-transferase
VGDADPAYDLAVTGATVAQTAEVAMSLIFYYGSGSPYAWKVWLALEHKKIAYEFRQLSFDRGDTKSAEFRAVTPRGRVPTIVDEGFAVWESLAILEYLEERYPENPLLPKDARGRATARRLALEADNYLAPAIGPLFDLTLYHEGPPASAEEIEAAKRQAMEELAHYEAAMTGPFFLGALSLADFSVFPHVRLLQRLEDRLPGKGIANERLPTKLGAWVKKVEALPYYSKTIPPHWKG